MLNKKTYETFLKTQKFILPRLHANHRYSTIRSITPIKGKIIPSK
jgi:hypothetical protein